MAGARVLEEEVKELAPTKRGVTLQIEAAHELVDAHLSGAGLSDSLLRQIELWLAAHLVAISDPRVKGKTVGDLSLSFEGQVGLGLDATRYGQQVRLLDPTGKLAALQNPGRKPVGFWSNAASGR